MPAGSDRLNAGESLRPGQSLVSKSKRFSFTSFANGNVLFDKGKQIWGGRAPSMSIARTDMQKDGNLVSYSPQGKAVWDTKTWGFAGAFVTLQDDGNLVVYQGRRALWDSQGHAKPPHSGGGGLIGSIGGWIGGAVQTTLNAPSNLAKEVGKAAKAIGLDKVMKDIGRSSFWAITPIGAAWNIADDIGHGKRLDRVALDAFKGQVKAAKDVAPYVQTVVSVVPGVGTGVSAALGAASALASGRPITDAIQEAAKAALPGGPAAAAAFEVATKAVQGKNVLASVLEAAQHNLPEAVRPAFAIGAALAHGRNLQQAVAQGAALVPGIPAPISKGLAAVIGTGKIASLKDTLIGAARDVLPGPAKMGFDAATGVLLNGKPIDAAAMNIVRQQVSSAAPQALAGFDAAVSLHLGRYGQFQAPISMTDPKARAAFYTAKGLRGAPAKVAVQTHAVLGVAAHPALKSGFAVGVAAAAKEKKTEDAALLLTKMRELMRLYRKRHAPTVTTINAMIDKGKTGDAKARATLTMLATADRANRELDGRRTPGAVVHVGGAPVLTYLTRGANTIWTIATIPFDWIKKTFFEVEAA
jgi:hypothetical protein